MNNTDKNRLQAFREEREELNEKTLNAGHLGIKRFFNMDANTYRDGALDSKTKELLGLVASSVLRCNDCIDYHLEQCAKTGSTKEEILDAMNVALIVGGSIVIPHLRRAVETIEMIEEEGAFQKTITNIQYPNFKLVCLDIENGSGKKSSHGECLRSKSV